MNDHTTTQPVNPCTRGASFCGQHGYDCPQPAAVSAVRPPATDRTALREAVAAVLRPHASLGGTPPRWEVPFFDGATPSLPRISGWRPLDEVADAVLAVLPEPADRAAIEERVARRLAGSWVTEEDWLRRPAEFRQDYLEYARDVLAVAAEPAAAGPDQKDETGDGDTQDDEAEKLAKARRMAKAMSAPLVAPDQWAATTEWPTRHKRPADRRVHATAPFVVYSRQQIWAACGKHVGPGGYALNHMPVDCRDCKQVLAADAPAVPLVGSAASAQDEKPPVCQGFVWIGQSFATCDRCGQPAWEHEGQDAPVEGAGPFDNRRTVRPWEPGEADAIRAKWGTPAAPPAVGGAQQPKTIRCDIAVMHRPHPEHDWTQRPDGPVRRCPGVAQAKEAGA